MRRFIPTVIIGAVATMMSAFALKLWGDLAFEQTWYLSRALHIDRIEHQALWDAVEATIPAIPGIAVAVAIARVWPKPLPTETCCRKCQYILRGITEPRCPECGEPI